MNSKRLFRKFSHSFSDLLSVSKKYDLSPEELCPFLEAVDAGNIKLVECFISKNSSWIDKIDKNGQTALHLSINAGNTEMSSLLLRGGIDVEKVDFDGFSACHLACKNGMIDHFNLLFYYHVNLFSIDNFGRTPFDVACEYGQEKMIQCLLNCEADLNKFKTMDESHLASAMHLAARNGHVQIVSILVSKGWNLNHTIANGSVLHEAANHCQLQVVRLLLKYQINTFLTDAHGLTALESSKKNYKKNPVVYKELCFLLKNFTSFTDAIAITDYCGLKPNELNFSCGDKIWIIEHSGDIMKGILFGSKGNSLCGYFDKNAVREITINQKETEKCCVSRERFFEKETLTRPQYLKHGIGKMLNRKHENSWFGTCSFLPSVRELPTVKNLSNSFYSNMNNDSNENSTSSSLFLFSMNDDENISKNHLKLKNLDINKMILNGNSQQEIIEYWLHGLNMEQYSILFLNEGYDIQTIASCSFADFLALGIKHPEHRKIIAQSIEFWKVTDKWLVEDYNTLKSWLQFLNLDEYLQVFNSQHFHFVNDILYLEWEDFEDIGIKKLGHLKKIEVALKKTRILMEAKKPNFQNYSEHALPSIYDRKTNSAQQTYYPEETQFGAKKNFETTCLPLLEDAPIRLQLVQAGKILNDFSKLEKNMPQQLVYPKHSLNFSSNAHLLSSTRSFCDNDTKPNSSEFTSLLNLNCNRIYDSTTHAVSMIDVPGSLPPLPCDDFLSESSSTEASIEDLSSEITEKHDT